MCTIILYNSRPAVIFSAKPIKDAASSVEDAKKQILSTDNEVYIGSALKSISSAVNSCPNHHAVAILFSCGNESKEN